MRLSELLVVLMLLSSAVGQELGVIVLLLRLQLAVVRMLPMIPASALFPTRIPRNTPYRPTQRRSHPTASPPPSGGTSC